MNFSPARAKEVVILKPCTEEKERYAFIIESISCYIANNIIDRNTHVATTTAAPISYY